MKMLKVQPIQQKDICTSNIKKNSHELYQIIKQKKKSQDSCLHPYDLPGEIPDEIIAIESNITLITT